MTVDTLAQACNQLLQELTFNIVFILQYGEGTGTTTNQTHNPICDTKYYTKVIHAASLCPFHNVCTLIGNATKYFIFEKCYQVLSSETMYALQIEDRPIVKEVKTYVREHHPVEKEFVVETRPTGMSILCLAFHISLLLSTLLRFTSRQLQLTLLMLCVVFCCSVFDLDVHCSQQSCACCS